MSKATEQNQAISASMKGIISRVSALSRVDDLDVSNILAQKDSRLVFMDMVTCWDDPENQETPKSMKNCILASMIKRQCTPQL